MLLALWIFMDLNTNGGGRNVKKAFGKDDVNIMKD
jgi:hypothetical protein